MTRVPSLRSPLERRSLILRNSATLRRAALACGLLLLTGGCPQSAPVDDNADSGLPLANPGSNSGGGQSGGTNTGGSGGGGSQTGGDANPLDRSAILTPSSPTLFVADLDRGVASFANAHVLNGDVAPSAFFDTNRRFVETFRDSGGNTFDSMSPTGLCVDRVGTLVVQSVVATSNAAADTGLLQLRFYDDAATVAGIPAADRQTSIGANGDLGGIAYDRANDRLFTVVDDQVLIFEGAALAQSASAPTRAFSNPDIPDASIALGPNGDLYVTGGFQTVLVFANAGLRTGQIAPDRVIFLSGFSRETVFVDASDRLYVTDVNEIAVLEKASTLDGTIDNFPVIALQNLSGQGAVQNAITGVTVDSRGIGYVAVGESGEIHIIDNIATRSGDVRANRALAGSSVEFGDADAIFVWE